MAQTKKMASEKLTLDVTLREIFGKKLKKLRKDGLIPGNVYGPEFKSQSLSLNYKDFAKVYELAKKTGIVYLKLNKEEIPVLIKNVQRHPVADAVLHVDLRKVDLKQKVETEVPVKIIGESEAVTQQAGVLLIQSDKLLVEALPQDIPPAIEVNISSLKEIGKELKVADLAKSSKYKIKTPLNKVVVSIIEHKEESVVPETAVQTPEVITEVQKPEETTAEEKEEKPAPTPKAPEKIEKKEVNK